MKLIHFKIFGLFFLLIACGKNESKKEETKANHVEENNTHSPYEQNKSSKKHVKNAFVNNPFKIEENCKGFISKIKNIGYIESKESIKNSFNEKFIDTILSYKKENNIFKFIKTSDKCFLVQSIIFESDVELKNDIKIGMTRTQFLSSFQIKDNNEIINFVDEEEYSEVSFFFKDDILIKVIVDKGFE